MSMNYLKTIGLVALMIWGFSMASLSFNQFWGIVFVGIAAYYLFKNE